MIRIALVARPATGGLRTHLLQLIRHLTRPDFQTILLAPRDLLDSLPGDLPEIEHVPNTIGSKLSLLDFVAAVKVWQRSQTVDVVHAHGLRAALVCSLATLLRRFPLVVTLHNVPSTSVVSSGLLRFIEYRSAKIVTVSHAIAKCLSVDAAVIPNGIDLNSGHHIERHEARRSLGLDENAFVVAAAGRLSHEKGFDVLIESARGNPKLIFAIAGDGPLREKLEKLAPPNVRFLGLLESIAGLFSAADCVAVPSRSEGQGIVVLEAFAAGVAVVGTRVGGIPEAIENHVTGLLVPPEDPSALTAALLELEANVELRLRLAGAGKAASRAYDLQTQIRKTEDVYRSVIMS